ncbi:hypothetical protein RJT34_18600 [Clitoria ternatea]|uniref:Uncharacterized protein n=1 Tax=Clitoria ternatea TaxID=43366 RepID=A0AAN9JEA1_CLITE
MTTHVKARAKRIKTPRNPKTLSHSLLSNATRVPPFLIPSLTLIPIFLDSTVYRSRSHVSFDYKGRTLRR